MLPKEFENVYIQSYKHDGSLHRTWSRGFVVEANCEQIVVITDHAWVIEADGRKWLTREPAVCFLYPKKWYNVISMIRQSGIYYYCNLASPTLYDGEALKNIDYDLDVKLFPDHTYQILDEQEFLDHSKKMQYSQEIIRILRKEMDQLLKDMEEKQCPFQEDVIQKYYQKYIQYTKCMDH